MKCNVFRNIIVDGSDGFVDSRVTRLIVYPPHVSIESVLSAQIQAGIELFDSGFTYSRGDTHCSTRHKHDKGIHEEYMAYLFSVPMHTSHTWIKHKYRDMGFNIEDVEVEEGSL